jgi:hypothetical protein
MLGKYFPVRSSAITTGFDYYRRTEPLVILFGPSPRGFNYYRRAEPIQGLR